ncbi:MAG: CoA transferase [Candidatus Entotheonella factor]|uniref:CoA transferase n=1 Tax=Entotheonella factor TaxID=1429438 RepID=W4LL30_ENTF1|nr:MAG: CoA transferase [Candidatus Entotheonella factor]
MNMVHHDRLLAGLRVIDAGHVLAGPFVGTLLADLGAEVIKLELPELAKQGSKAGSALRAVEYRNKKSVTLNLRQPEGQELARKLVSVSDAWVENYSPGTMEKWGLGFDDLAKANPRIIMVRVSGYGQTGPYRDRTSYDRIGQAVGGMLYVTGEPDRPPAHPGYMLGDYITGTFGALSILSAVYHRDHMACNEPQLVDLSLYESVFRYSGQLAPEYSQTGYVRERAGTVRAWSIPGDQFQSRDGKWVLILALSPNLWERLAKAMGQPELVSDPRFANPEARLEHVEALHGIIREWVASLDAVDVYRILSEWRVPFGPINSIADIFDDPHYQAREDLVTVEDPLIGKVAMPAVYPRLSHAAGRVYNPAPVPGQHNREIYQELLGLSEAECDRLQAAGTI